MQTIFTCYFHGKCQKTHKFSSPGAFRLIRFRIATARRRCPGRSGHDKRRLCEIYARCRLKKTLGRCHRCCAFSPRYLLIRMEILKAVRHRSFRPTTTRAKYGVHVGCWKIYVMGHVTQLINIIYENDMRSRDLLICIFNYIT